MITDWIRTIKIGTRGRVQFFLEASVPLVSIQMRLATGQVVGEITGDDLRDTEGIGFSMPRVAGEYFFTLRAKDMNDCVNETITPRSITVIP